MNKTEPHPFTNDIAYILAELEWIKTRSRRIGFGNELDEYAQDVSHTKIGNTKKTKTEELNRRYANMLEEENTLRGEIDERLLRNREAGPIIGLEAICHKFNLEKFERTLLLLSVLPTLGEDLTKVFDHSFGAGFCGRYLTVNGVWEFLELSVEERIKSRLTLLPEAPLLKFGLISMDIGRCYTPAKITDAYVELTHAAFSIIVGMPELDRPVEADKLSDAAGGGCA
jgi:hypothetical protein